MFSLCWKPVILCQQGAVSHKEVSRRGRCEKKKKVEAIFQLFCFLSFCFVLCIFFQIPVQAHSELQSALILLEVNKVKKDQIFIFLKGKDILVQVSDLKNAGLRGFKGTREIIHQKKYVSLLSLSPEVTFKLLMERAVLSLMAAPSLLGKRSLSLRYPVHTPVLYSKNSSFFFNYSLGLANFKQPSLFGEAGYSLNGGLLYSSFFRSPSGELVRDLTNYTLNDPVNLTTLTAGDTFVQSNTPLGGSAPIAGINYSSDFGLNPYFISSPSFNIGGAVTTPSVAQVYINGQLSRQINLQPGEFNLQNLPIVTGSGNVKVLIKNAFGQVQQLSYPYYYSSQLLAKGLEKFSYNLGFVREGLGTSSFDYGPLAFSVFREKGLSDSLTAGFQLQGEPGMISGGPVITAATPIGQITASLAGSQSQGFFGEGASFGYEYQGKKIGFNYFAEFQSSHYSNLGLSPNFERPILQQTGSFSFPAGFLGSLTLQYLSSRFPGNSRSDSLSLLDTLTLPGGLGLFFQATHFNSTSSGSENEVQIGLNYGFGSESTANLSIDTKKGETTRSLELQKSLPQGVGYGYNLQDSQDLQSSRTGAGNDFTGELDYQSPIGLYELNEAEQGGHSSTNLTVSGGIVGIGGKFYASRTIEQGFALVEVPGVKGVRVYSQNQLIGITNAKGELLIPEMLPYYGNKISIAQKDIPLNYEVRVTEITVAPTDRGGALIVFPVYRFQMIIGKVLLNWKGKILIPNYGELKVKTKTKTYRSPVGGNGDLYFENIPPGKYPASLKYNHHVYRFLLLIPVSKKTIINLRKVFIPVPQGIIPCQYGVCRYEK